MFSNKLNYKIINITAFLLLFYIGFSNISLWFHIFKSIISLLFPFLFSFATAYALSPLVNLLIKKRIKKCFAITLVIIGFSLFLLSLIVVTLPLIYDQTILFSRYILSILDHIANKFHLSLGNVELELSNYLNTMIKNLDGIIQNGAFSIIGKSVHFLSQFVIGYISGIYFLYDMPKIRKKISKISKKISIKCYQYIKCLDQEIGNYIKGLSMIMIVQFIEYSFLFLLVGHPNWLLLSILASITTVIPYFGGILTNIIGLVIATTISTKVLIGTTIVCIFCPFIDSYFISPKIYGKTNEIHPLTTIIILFIGEKIFGIMGMIISLPIYLLCRSTYLFFQKKLKKQVKNITSNI